jgi:hypothetical protein
MNANLGREQDFKGFQQDWEAVGGYLSSALHEVATDLGGEELASRVALAATSDEVLPNPPALKMLEDIHPGSAKLVLTRTQEIQQETHQRELNASNKPNLRKYGRAILEGFASFNIFGTQLRKR